MRVGYLGPAGTNTHEALLGRERAARQLEPVALPTIHDCVDGRAERRGRARVRADRERARGDRSTRRSTRSPSTREDVDDRRRGRAPDPHVPDRAHAAGAERDRDRRLAPAGATASARTSCARACRRRACCATSSTAEAVRAIAEREHGRAPRRSAAGIAAQLYGCEVLRAGVDDVPGNETRFVWLAPRGATPTGEHGPWKTSIVFWGVGDEAPGWLVRCLSEFAFRGVNLTRIESRPRKQGLGHYMFFLDLEGRDDERPVAEALAALRGHTEHLRVLGSFPPLRAADSHAPGRFTTSRRSHRRSLHFAPRSWPASVPPAQSGSAPPLEHQRRGREWWPGARPERDVRADQRLHRSARGRAAAEGEGRDPRARRLRAALRAASTVPRPIVIRLVTYVRVPRDTHRRKITRRAVFARDDWTCQYCGSRGNLTVDHVIPRSKGGGSTLGQHRRLLRAVQPPQGRLACPSSRRDDPEAHAAARPAPTSSSTSPARRSRAAWRSYLAA